MKIVNPRNQPEPLTKEEFLTWNTNCKFEHEYEGQSNCSRCGIHVTKINKCPREKKAYNKYISQFSHNKALQIIMVNTKT